MIDRFYLDKKRINSLLVQKAAYLLKVGDRLRSDDGETVTVEAVCDSGTIETVYNCRVAEYHTYFIGSAAWQWSVWAHNACTGQTGGTESHPEFKNFNDAQRAAQSWLKTRGFNPAMAERSVSKFTGEVNGMKADRTGFRIEFDARNGAHINVFSGKEKGPHFLFPGNDNSVKSILRQLFGG